MPKTTPKSPKSLEEKEEIFRKYVLGKGLKFTRERREILKTLPGYDRHFDFDAEYLLLRAREKDLRISRDTIYRTLPLLVESGLIRKVLEGSGRHSRYEVMHGRIHHEHLICTECGAVIEFVNEEIERLQDGVCQKYGFEPISHSLNIFGRCKNHS
ncbi:MAG: transcriptional repressor [Candidatus Omnitrophica bacterium]|nr:transcriptional repressor [Candidatus Omnitrophota bacterium]